MEEALEIAGLGHALARAVRTYSQGMRQRLAIAQAMLELSLTSSSSTNRPTV